MDKMDNRRTSPLTGPSTTFPRWTLGTPGNTTANVAGKNLSAAILKSPHGKGVLNKLPKVGILAE
jgi:Predicted heme/steroid binding protein